MTTRKFEPGPKKPPPGVIASKPIMLPASLTPLIAPRPVPRTKLQIIIPVVVVVAVVGMMAVMFSQPGLRSGPMLGVSMFFPLMMIGSMATMMRGGGHGGDQQMSPAQLELARREYLRDLDELRDAVNEAAGAQFEQFAYVHPGPDLLLGAVGSDRMWERSRGMGTGR